MHKINARSSAAPRRGVCLTPMETRRDVIVEMAVLADKLGYEVFSVPEGWGFDSTLILTEIALRTKRIRPMSGILSVWTRTPGAIAMNAATLSDISGGRYMLGLGASTRALVEGFHGARFERPARRLRRTTREVRRLLRGERAARADDVESRALKLGQPPRPEIPIYIASMGPLALKATKDLADGWFPYNIGRDRVATMAASMRADRDGDFPLTVAAGPTLAVTEDPAVSRRIVETNIAWYLTAMGDVYANALVQSGHGEAVAAVKAANPQPSPKRGHIPDEASALLDQLAAFGAPEAADAALRRWDEVADVVMLGIAPGMAWADIETSLQAAAPATVEAVSL